MKKTLRRTLQFLALALTVAAVGFWAAAGANRGWSKTSVPKKSLDEVTGIEGVTYEEHFVPGVDFLGAAMLGAGILAGVSLLFRNNATRSN